MTSPTRDKILRMDGWPGGVNNRVRETEQVIMRDGESIQSSQFLRRALNVDLTQEGHPLRRQGYALARAGYAHSAWYSRELARFFVVVDGQLLSGDSAATLAPFQNVNRYLRMSYTEHAGVVYYANGADSGKYGVNGYGVWPDASKVPSRPPTDEGGTGELIGVEYKHYHGVLPVGQLVRSHKGRLWVARNETINISHAMFVDYHRPATELIQQPRYIDMLEPVDGGVYVGDATSIRFIQGTDPFDVTQIHVYDSGVVRGAFARIPGEKFEMEVDTVPVWWCRDGTLLLGMPNGQVRQLTRDRLAIAEFDVGAVSLREREGMSQIVSSLQKGGDENNMGATDTVVAEVRSSVNP
jgi:hypothetical protein